MREISAIYLRECLKSRGPLWPWSYGSWTYNYLCNQWPSPLMLWVRISIRVRDVQHYVIKFVIDLRQVGGFLRVLPVSSTNKTDRHDITEILLKVMLNTNKQTNKQTNTLIIYYYPSRKYFPVLFNKNQEDNIFDHL